MTALFSSPKTPDIPQPVVPDQPKAVDQAVDNAGNAERLRRMRALGKQKSIFAGDMMMPTLSQSTLG